MMKARKRLKLFRLWNKVTTILGQLHCPSQLHAVQRCDAGERNLVNDPPQLLSQDTGPHVWGKDIERTKEENVQ